MAEFAVLRYAPLPNRSALMEARSWKVRGPLHRGVDNSPLTTYISVLRIHRRLVFDGGR